MSVLVTGGAGYIGSHMTAALRAADVGAVVLDDLSTGHRAAVKDAPLVQCNLLDTDAVTAVMRQHNVDAVIHFAAKSLVEESMLDPVKYFKNNIAGTVSLLEAMQKADVRHIVFSSSASVYGDQDEMPIREEAEKRPASVYGHTKLMIEHILRLMDAQVGIRYCALRYFNAAGAHPSGDIGEAHHPETHLIPRAIQALLADEPFMLTGVDYPTEDRTCVRDYVHIMDLVDAHLLALDALRGGAYSAAYNVGSGVGYSVRQILSAVQQVAGKPLLIQERPRRAGDPAILVASPDKIKRELNWQPKHQNITDIVASALNWHSRHPKGYEA